MASATFFRAHQIGALLVDHAALVIGDVVVFKQLLAGIKIMLFDPPLRALDLPRQHAALDRLARFHADARHQRLHARRVAENAHQVVFERQIEAARARDRPAARSGRATDCRCAGTRGVRCR